MDAQEEAGAAHPTLAENMRLLMKRSGITGIGMLREHMRTAGLAIGTSTLHRAVQGQVGNRLESLAKIAQFFDVTTDQLLQPDLGVGEEAARVTESSVGYGLGPIRAWEHQGELPPDAFVLIPRLHVQLSSAGQPRTVVDYEEAQLFRTDWIRHVPCNVAKTATITAADDSMERTIYRGDSLLVDTSDTEVADGRIYALWYDGGERVKRLFRLPGGGLRIVSDNDRHPSIQVGAADLDHLRIIGRVVHRSGTGGL